MLGTARLRGGRDKILAIRALVREERSGRIRQSTFYASDLSHSDEKNMNFGKVFCTRINASPLVFTVRDF